jgi:HD-like signal output (HDOD) protein
VGWFRKKKDEEKKAEPAPAVASEASPPGPAGVTITAANLSQRKKPPELADLFLVMEEHLNDVELDDVRAVVRELQQPPPLVERLTRGLDDPEELRDAIMSSPTLSADVLRVVNSAAFSLPNPISSIDHAVTYLGTTMVKGLVVQSAVTQVMRFESDVQKASYMRAWRSSYIASTTAQTFAEHLGMEDPSLFATRGLLVNIGDLALMSAQPQLASIYAPKTTLLGRIEDQQNEFMANSAVLSAMLAREWNLPDELYSALRHSLTPLTWDPDSNERTPGEQREDVLLYFACRVGDAVAYAGLKDPAAFDVMDPDAVDLFYLPDYLRRLDLGSLPGVLRDAKASRRIQQTVSTLS